jgi:catechol 2,3-dioxygenase-like lactoylglutathione lyase family enzyme
VYQDISWRRLPPTAASSTVTCVERGRLVGINHVALEVGDIEEALAFYGSVFELTLRGRTGGMAFVDMGDQFVALSQGRSQAADTHRHFGLVVDDKEAVRGALEAAGAEILPGRGLDFRDPWGNLVQIVQYDEVQFMKTAAVLEAMGLELEKGERALAELRAKGIEPG